MTWARHANPVGEHNRFTEARESERIHDAIQHSKAARTVADHAASVEDCALLLAMLGLNASDGKNGQFA